MNRVGTPQTLKCLFAQILLPLLGISEDKFYNLDDKEQVVNKELPRMISQNSPRGNVIMNAFRGLKNYQIDFLVSEERSLPVALAVGQEFKVPVLLFGDGKYYLGGVEQLLSPDTRVAIFATFLTDGLQSLPLLREVQKGPTIRTFYYLLDCEFPVAKDNLEHVDITSLVDLSLCLDVALVQGQISEHRYDVIKAWTRKQKLDISYHEMMD